MKQETSVKQGGKKYLYRNKSHPKQLLVFFVFITLYLFYYFSKSNLSAATQPIQEAFGFSSAQFGVILTAASLVYALGQFINGNLTDRLGAKKMFFIGAIGAVVWNFCFGFSSSFVFFFITWMGATYFLSMGWAPSMKLMYSWFPQNRWGFFSGVSNAFCFFGSAIVLPVAGLCIANFGWRSAFFVPPLFTLAMALVFFFIVKNTPQEDGFEVEWQNDANVDNTHEEITSKDYIACLLNKKMIVTDICYFLTNMLRWAMASWVVKILMDSPDIGGFGLAVVTASLIGSMMHWGGAVLCLVAGWVQDKVFHGQRWQTIFICFLLAGIPLLYLTKGASILDTSYGVPLICVIMFLGGGLIQTICCPIFNIPGDVLGNRLAATGVGIMNGFGYLGAAFAGVGFGALMDAVGGTNSFYIISALCVVGALLSLLLRPDKKERDAMKAAKAAKSASVTE
ncbi:MAG: MFS transporter [Clostridiales bacterium]